MEVVDRLRQRTFENYESYLRNCLHQQNDKRRNRWSADYSTIEDYQESVQPLRDRLRAMLGFWSEPEKRPAVKQREIHTFHEDRDLIAQRFTFDLCDGLSSYAVELVPSSGNGRALLLQHGYAGTPEAICGFTAGSNGYDFTYRSLGLRAVRRGFHVLAVHHPYGYGTTDECAGGLPRLPNHGSTVGKNRLHRLATLAGATGFGLDILACSRAFDLLIAKGFPKECIGVYGLSQGGQSAMFLAAVDTRVSACVCSAYFNDRLKKLIGPARSLTYLDSTEEDKFFTEVVSSFSDVELAGLIAPRALAIEAGKQDRSVDFSDARAAYEEARQAFDLLGVGGNIEFIAHRDGHVPVTGRAFSFLEEHLRCR
jgi:hypothetical protein